MSIILQKPLPHGKVSVTGVADKATREVIVLLNENVASLHKQLSELQIAVRVLEQGVKAAS